MKKIFLLWIVNVFCMAATAQKNGNVKGMVLDKLSGQPLEYATVTLLEKKDSSLVSFTMTDESGRFELGNLRNNDYRLLITHSAYQNYNHLFNISEPGTIDLGNLALESKSKTLEEVVVQAEAPPVTLINDTVQYNAGSFKTAPNANVQDLLKKLPGVKVDKDGTIKAQGEKVNRVLVDGKEFFGNDPKIATQNLPADAVDKVQVYDRQSEQAQLTGFEDGNTEKTINLKLKKDNKKGKFGKLNAGTGTRDRYEGKFNVNSFKGARQASVIGMGNNTNAEGFSFMDILNFTGEMGRMQRNGGGSINISGEDAAALGIGGNRNSGIRTAWAGGFNYNNIIGSKTDLQSNYFYNSYNPKMESSIQRQYFLPGSSYYYNQHAQTDNQNNTHRLNLNTLFQLDSSTSLRIIPSLSLQNTANKSFSQYETRAADHSLTNQGSSHNNLLNEGYNFRNEILFRKKLKKKGRTFSLSLQSALNESDGETMLNAVNHFYEGGSLILKDTLRQQSILSASLQGHTAKMVYTEPLFRRSLLEFSAGQSKTKNIANRTTYDYDEQGGKYNKVNSQLSNDFENIFSYTNAGIRLRTQRKKFNVSGGATWQRAELEGKTISGLKDSIISKTFYNILPNARFQYNFSRYKTLSLQYNANTTQPGINQLQPVPDNSNPLNIKTGNPLLKQEYSHSLRTMLNLVSPFSNRNLFANITIQSTNNKIVNYDSVNSRGIVYSKPVNVDGVVNLNGSLSYSRPLVPGKLSAEVSSRFGYYIGKQFINTHANRIKSVFAGPELRLNINPHKNLNLALSAAWDINKTGYSLQKNLNAKYLRSEYSADVEWQMPSKFFLSSGFSYTINSQRAAGFNNKLPLWNAAISRHILNLNRGEIKLSAVDILNKNIGISRNNNQNYIEDSRVNTLRQYFLLSFTYSLTKVGLTNDGRGGGFRMRM